MILNTKVSIIMPSLNVVEYIHDCMESVIHQTLNDIEIICVDAGSTDGTLEILQEYVQKDERVKLIISDKKSYGYQINLGMKSATGEYIGILETDDIINLKMYETLYQYAKKYDLDIVKADFYRFVIEDGVMKKEYVNIAQTEMYNKVLTNNNVGDIITKAALYTWSGIYKKSFLLINNIRHNETLGASYQDNGFWFQTMATAKRVYFLNQPFYMLRRDNPNSSIFSKGKVYCIRDEYEFVLNYLKQNTDLYQSVIAYYWWARFGAYRYSYRRIAIEYKEEFIMHFQQTFMEAKEKGELEQNVFSKTSWHDLEQILNDPIKYNEKHKRELHRAEQKRTFWRRFIWCYEDNGLEYTIKHIIRKVLKKLGFKFSNERLNEYAVKPINKRLNKVENNLNERINNIELVLQKQEQEIAELLEIQKNLLNEKNNIKG